MLLEQVDFSVDKNVHIKNVTSDLGVISNTTFVIYIQTFGGDHFC